MGKPPKSKASGKEAPGLEAGDHVYAKHPQHGAMVLKVLASGRDGFTGADGDGGRHQIPHDGYLGHKTRMLHTYKVVDEGADGSLLEDDAGKRRYLAGEMPKPPDSTPEESKGSKTDAFADDPLVGGLKTLTKAMHAPRPLLLPPGLALLLKAAPAAQPSGGRPGLSQRRIVDRGGRAQNRWVKTVKDQPKPRRRAASQEPQEAKTPQQQEAEKRPAHKHGDQVTFRHGDVEGSGKIVGSGQDGVTVQDKDGREHQVRHEALDPPQQYPDRTEGEDDKSYLKRNASKMSSPKDMPEDHERFFNMGPDTQTIPMDQLVSTKSDAENAKGGGNAPKFMMAAYHGKVAKRDPISVKQTPDGKYQVVDGNGTFTGAKAAGWKALPVNVVGGDKPADGEKIKPLFDDADTAKLPDKASQPVNTQEELYAKATEANAALQDWLNRGKGVASQLGYETMKGSPEEADMDKPGGMLFIAPLKGAKRAAEKVEQDYGGDWSQLLDPVRASMAVDTYDELERAMTALTASGMKLARKPKDRFSRPLPVGYRDALLNVTLPNGLIGELQLHVKPMLKAKGLGHKHYEVERSLNSKKLTGLSDEESATLQASIVSQTDIYNQAWQTAISGSSQTSEGSMSKAIGGGQAYKYFEHDNAKFRRLDKPPFRAIDDVLHDKQWVDYKGDKLEPGLFGEEIPDPLGSTEDIINGPDKPNGGKGRRNAAAP